VFAELDCLFSLAKSSIAIGEPACRPEFVEGDEAWLEFEELRHPALCVEVGKGRNFIPNDVRLGGGVGRIALLTGELVGRCLDSLAHRLARRTEYGVRSKGLASPRSN
jgi:DNA mismatch repair protein MSH6